jgi:hypothetical protein
MNTMNEILRTLGRIEGRLEAMQTLPGRVSKIEAWQFWFKGAWGALMAGWAYLFRIAWAR